MLAQDVLDAHFEADAANPAILVVPEDDLQPTLELVGGYDGVAADGATYLPAGPPTGDAPPAPRVVDGEVVVFATLIGAADSAEATDTVRDAASATSTRSAPDITVGGATAIQLDTRDTTGSDRLKVIPAILVVIFIVLALLLRSLAAPLLLLLANVLSFGATMGIAALLFNYVFDFPASDPSTVLIGFVFLVALGIDYSIFLMTRVREESLRQGTHPGVLKGLSVTGGVITSAGVVLAATFAALAVVPLLFLAQIAFIVAFGVLLDTLVVRSLLVPALSYDLGPRVWWPSKLWHTPDHADESTTADAAPRLRRRRPPRPREGGPQARAPRLTATRPVDDVGAAPGRSARVGGCTASASSSPLRPLGLGLLLAGGCGLLGPAERGRRRDQVCRPPAGEPDPRSGGAAPAGEHRARRVLAEPGTAARAAAYASGFGPALRRLYVEGAGDADLRVLRGYLRRGLRGRGADGAAARRSRSGRIVAGTLLPPGHRPAAAGPWPSARVGRVVLPADRAVDAAGAARAGRWPVAGQRRARRLSRLRLTGRARRRGSPPACGARRGTPRPPGVAGRPARIRAARWPRAGQRP